MANLHSTDHDTAIGMAGGTLLAVFMQLDGSDVVRTLLLASIGAVASFLVSQFCKWCAKKIKAKFSKDDV